MGRFGWVMFMLGGRGWIGRDREEGEEGGVGGNRCRVASWKT